MMVYHRTIFTGIILSLTLFQVGCKSLSAISQDLLDPGKQQREKKEKIVSALEDRRADAKIKAAYARLEEKDQAGAKQLLTEVLQSDSENEQAYLLMAEILITENRFEEALTCYQQVLTTSPNQAEVHHHMATLYELAGAPQQAQFHFLKASELEPQNPLYRMSMLPAPAGSMMR